jgi:hypothetical protein
VIVRRFVFVMIVGLLTISASGVSSVIVTEPCNAGQLAGEDDGRCSPTCVTCGCCAQAVETATVTTGRSPDVLATRIAAVLPRLPRTDPREILHVPRLRPA